MKYIKTFEYSKKAYNPGDYIIFDSTYSHIINSYKGYAVVKRRTHGQKQYVSMNQYDIDYLDANDFSIKNFEMFFINQDEIIRLMTKKEIDDFKLKSATAKYNL